MARLVRPSSLLAAAAATVATACADRAPVAPEGRQPAARPAANLVDGATAGGGQYLVGVAPGTSVSATAIAAVGGRLVGSVPKLGVYVVAGVSDPAALRQATGASYVERDVAVTIDAQALGPSTGPVDAPASSGAAAAPTWVASGMQWDLKAMKADQTITAGARGAGINVCIIDSGVDGTHQELAGKVDLAQSFVAGAPERDEAGHGTHVAGSVAAKGLVMSGVAPDARLFNARVFDATGSSASIKPFLEAIVWCADNGAHVINMSLGGIRYLAGQPASANPDVQAYTTAMNYATSRGVVVVTSAGNGNLRLPNPAQITVPAQIPGTIIVGATAPISRNVPVRQVTNNVATILTVPRNVPASWDPFDPAQVVAGPDARAYYSNFGTGVDVFAPGGRTAHSLAFALRITTEPVLDATTRLPVVPAQTARVQHGTVYDAVWSACSRFGTYNGARDVGGLPGTTAACRTAADPTVRYAALQGTSMAAPHVAGLAAVLYEAAGGTRSVATRAKVEQCIRTTTDNIGPSTTFGNGRVNAVKALACMKS